MRGAHAAAQHVHAHSSTPTVVTSACATRQAASSVSTPSLLASRSPQLPPPAEPASVEGTSRQRMPDSSSALLSSEPQPSSSDGLKRPPSPQRATTPSLEGAPASVEGTSRQGMTDSSSALLSSEAQPSGFDSLKCRPAPLRATTPAPASLEVAPTSVERTSRQRMTDSSSALLSSEIQPSSSDGLKRPPSPLRATAPTPASPKAAPALMEDIPLHRMPDSSSAPLPSEPQPSVSDGLNRPPSPLRASTPGSASLKAAPTSFGGTSLQGVFSSSAPSLSSEQHPAGSELPLRQPLATVSKPICRHEAPGLLGVTATANSSSAPMPQPAVSDGSERLPSQLRAPSSEVTSLNTACHAAPASTDTPRQAGPSACPPHSPPHSHRPAQPHAPGMKSEPAAPCSLRIPCQPMSLSASIAASSQPAQYLATTAQPESENVPLPAAGQHEQSTTTARPACSSPVVPNSGFPSKTTGQSPARTLVTGAVLAAPSFGANVPSATMTSFALGAAAPEQPAKFSFDPPKPPKLSFASNSEGSWNSAHLTRVCADSGVVFATAPPALTLPAAADTTPTVASTCRSTVTDRALNSPAETGPGPTWRKASEFVVQFADHEQTEVAPTIVLASLIPTASSLAAATASNHAVEKEQRACEALSKEPSPPERVLCDRVKQKEALKTAAAKWAQEWGLPFRLRPLLRALRSVQNVEESQVRPCAPNPTLRARFHILSTVLCGCARLDSGQNLDSALVACIECSFRCSCQH